MCAMKIAGAHVTNATELTFNQSFVVEVSFGHDGNALRGKAVREEPKHSSVIYMKVKSSEKENTLDSGYMEKNVQRGVAGRVRQEG